MAAVSVRRAVVLIAVGLAAIALLVYQSWPSQSAAEGNDGDFTTQTNAQSTLAIEHPLSSALPLDGERRRTGRTVEEFDAVLRSLSRDAQGAAASPLPPVDAPILDQLRLLQPRAASGDHAASCRLAAVLQNCAGFDRASRLGRRPPEQCAPLAEESRDLWPWYLLRAADAGYADAMLAVVDPATFDTDLLIRQPSLADVLHQRVPRYLSRLHEAGNPWVLGPLGVWIQQPGMQNVLGILPADLRDPAIVDAVTQRLSAQGVLPHFSRPGGAEQTWQGMSDGQQVRAEALYQRYFTAHSEYGHLQQYPAAARGRRGFPYNDYLRRATQCEQPPPG